MELVKRTTIFLPEELHEQLREEAFRRRLSMAELIRSKLGKRGGASRRTKSKVDPLLAVSGIGSDGELTVGIDEALYGS